MPQAGCTQGRHHGSSRPRAAPALDPPDATRRRRASRPRRVPRVRGATTAPAALHPRLFVEIAGGSSASSSPAGAPRAGNRHPLLLPPESVHRAVRALAQTDVRERREAALAPRAPRTPLSSSTSARFPRHRGRDQVEELVDEADVARRNRVRAGSPSPSRHGPRSPRCAVGAVDAADEIEERRLPEPASGDRDVSPRLTCASARRAPGARARLAKRGKASNAEHA